MVVVPALTGVTTPEVETFATPVFDDTQTGGVIERESKLAKVMVDPIQTLDGPVIGLAD